jgi:rod shape-determining protein MreD
MRSFTALAAAAVVAMLVQTAVLARLTWLPVVPDLLLVLAVYLGIRHPSVGGAAGAFLLGYFLDTFSGTVVGLHAFGLTAVYACTHVIARRVWVRHGLPIMAMVFVGGCVAQLAGVAVAALMAARAPLWQHVLRYGFLEAGVAALVAPAVFTAVTWEKRLLGLS